jgi:hypothetical protein
MEAYMLLEKAGPFRSVNRDALVRCMVLVTQYGMPDINAVNQVCQEIPAMNRDLVVSLLSLWN